MSLMVAHSLVSLNLAHNQLGNGAPLPEIQPSTLNPKPQTLNPKP
jgi:hypothetical protein